VVSSSDSETSVEVVEDSPCCSLPHERRPDCSDETHHWYTEDEKDIQPVDVFVPIVSRQRGVCNVWLLGVILLVPVGLVFAGHGGGLRGEEFRLDGLHADCGLMGRHRRKGVGCSSDREIQVE